VAVLAAAAALAREDAFFATEEGVARVDFFGVFFLAAVLLLRAED
jgi:hypothetical protein